MFGKAIKMKRFEHEMSQQDLADLLGVTPTYLSKVEKDRVCPSGELLYNIYTVLCVTPGNLKDNV